MKIAAMATGLAVLGVLAARPASAAPAAVRLASAWDLKEMTRDFPGAVETFKQADARAAAGRPVEALALFEQAARLAPQSPAPPRRRCELLTELGRREEALQACRETLKWGDAPEDFRAMVGALMSGSARPTSDEFVSALIMGGGVENRTPEDPMGHAAMFDIALRLQDHRLMRAQLRELERVAPDHYETGRARRIAGTLGPGLLTGAGWSLLLLLCAATIVRAVSRLRGKARLVPSAALAAALALLLSGSARAQEKPPTDQLSEFTISDQDPEATVPARSEFKKNPLQYGYLVMDLADKAEAATKRQDYEGAARFYRAIIKVAPDRAIGYGKVCEVYELAGERAKALAACRQALVTGGVRIDDYERFVRLTLAGTGVMAPLERTELDNVVAHLRKTPDSAATAADIECRVGVRLGDVPRLQRCTGELARLAPDGPNLVGYQWALATLTKDGPAAERALARARHAGVSVASVEKMAQATRRAGLTRAGSYAAAGAFLLASGVLLVSRRRELAAALARRSTS